MSEKRIEPGHTYRSERERRTTARAQITLLRHGEPDWAPGGGGSVEDPGLTPYGHAQAIHPLGVDVFRPAAFV